MAETLDTKIKDWIVDSPITNVRESNDESIFMQNTINSAISINKSGDEESTEHYEKYGENDPFKQIIQFDLSLPELPQTKPAYLKSYMSNSQLWIGFVTKISKTDFVAELEDINNPGILEIASFEMKEISREDIELFKIGAAFYWSVGYSVDNSQITKKSLIRFQRRFDWSESEYDKATDRANELNSILKWK